MSTVHFFIAILMKICTNCGEKYIKHEIKANKENYLVYRRKNHKSVLFTKRFSRAVIRAGETEHGSKNRPWFGVGARQVTFIIGLSTHPRHKRQIYPKRKTETWERTETEYRRHPREFKCQRGGRGTAGDTQGLKPKLPREHPKRCTQKERTARHNKDTYAWCPNPSSYWPVITEEAHTALSRGRGARAPASTVHRTALTAHSCRGPRLWSSGAQRDGNPFLHRTLRRRPKTSSLSDASPRCDVVANQPPDGLISVHRSMRSAGWGEGGDTEMSSSASLRDLVLSLPPHPSVTETPLSS